MADLSRLKTNKFGYVQDVFSAIAGRYDFANDLFSLGLHRLWKKKLVRLALKFPGRNTLDLAGGTGDMAFYFSQAGFQVTLADPNEAMVKVAQKRLGSKASYTITTAEALPFSPNQFDLVVVTFGFRNFQNLDQAFREIHRVLKPGGQFLALEFAPSGRAPMLRTSLWHGLFVIYNRYLMPFFARILFLPRSAYNYLAHSIQIFPSAPEIEAKLVLAQFRTRASQSFLGGKVQLFHASKPG